MRREQLNGYELHGTRSSIRARWDDEDDMVARDVGDEPYQTMGLIFGIIVVAVVILIGVVAMVVLGIASVF